MINSRIYSINYLLTEKKFLVCILCILQVGISMAQTPLGQYDIHKSLLYYNPGYTGIKADINFVSEFSYYGKNDQITHFQIDGRIPRLDSIKNLNLSVGAIYRNNVIGPIIQEHVGLMASNFFILKGGHKLSVGLQYDYIRTTIEKSGFVTPSDNSSISDPALVATKSYGQSQVLGVGMYFESINKILFGGISMDYRGIFDSDKDPGQNVGAKSDVPYFNASLGGQIEVGGKFHIVPTLVSRTDFNSTELRLTAKLFYKDWVYLGFSYGFHDNITFMAGGRFGWKKVGRFELGLASYYPKTVAFFENGFNIYLNYFINRKGRWESINYN